MTKVEVIKNGRRDNQEQGYKAGEKYASDQVSDLGVRLQRMEGFSEQIAAHIGLSSQVYVDVDPRPSGEHQKPGPKLGPHHNGALPKRSVDLGRRSDDGEVSLLTSNEGSPELPHVFTKWFSP